MKRVGFMASGLAFAALTVALAPSAAQTVRDFIRIAPEDVRFKSALGIGPEQAVLFGDPSKPGLYVIRVRFPPGATPSAPPARAQAAWEVIAYKHGRLTLRLELI